jgi:hypothetical protein
VLFRSINGGMDKAVDRRLEILGNDSVDKHEIARAEKVRKREKKRKDDDKDDGSGGIKPVSPP